MEERGAAARHRINDMLLSHSTEQTRHFFTTQWKSTSSPSFINVPGNGKAHRE